MSSRSDSAFHLARQTDNGYVRSDYGYFNQEAANTAAPVLNRVRLARGNQHYTHIVQMHGAEAIDVQPLERVA